MCIIAIEVITVNKNIKSANMHIRVNPETKEKAMNVLNDMGISISDLFNMLLSQVAIQHKIPFEIVDSKYVCAYGFKHDYSEIMPSDENEYTTFDSWKDTKEWLRA